MRCHFGLPQLPLASLVRHEAARAAPATMLAGPLEPFNAPNDWLVYGHLHLILALPTLTLLSVSPPLQNAQPLTKKAAYGFISFIVFVGVAQSFLWDSYGASRGFWEFNPLKCTLRDDLPLPLEEVLWLFHHVLKTAVYQLKAFELIPPNTSEGPPSKELQASMTAALIALTAFGVWALAASPDDSVKCIGLVCAFFAPVWCLIWQIGSHFVLRHADRIAWGWFAPGITTVAIDCLGQQQGVWRFPVEFLSGIGSGYLKLDIVLVYMVSTFAVTGTGAVILAATEELLARRASSVGPDGLPSLTDPELAATDDVTLVDLASYVFSRRLELGNEGEAFEYKEYLGGAPRQGTEATT